jgi:putative transposase
MLSPNSDWPRAPVHRFESDGIYMVTGATLQKEHVFADQAKLTLLQNELLTLARTYQWQLEAWAVFVNHYHFVARRNSESRSLDRFLRHLHANTSRKVNKLDDCVGRQTWHNFWDKKLTYERSYFARLNYVHQNAVKHGLVTLASNYPWCSAAWFERTVSSAVVKTIYSFKTDRLQIDDDY